MVCVVGGGISGLLIAYFLSHLHEPTKITLIEANGLSGQSCTEKYGDNLLEHSYYGVYLTNPMIFSIAQEIGIYDQIVYADKSFRHVVIPKEPYLAKVNIASDQWVRNQVLLFYEKFPFRMKLKKTHSLWDDMSVYQAFEHIFGKNVANYFGSSLTRGLFYQEAEDVVLSGVFGDIFSHIQNGMSIREAIDRKQQDDWNAGTHDMRLTYAQSRKGNAPFISFQGGMSTFVLALEHYLKKRGVVFVNDKIFNISSSAKNYHLYSNKKRYGYFGHVIFTTPPSSISRIFKNIDKDISHMASKLIERAVTFIFYGWSLSSTRFASGAQSMIIPSISKIPFLSTVFMNRLFPMLAPKKFLLTRTAMAGNLEMLDDNDIIRLTQDALQKLLDLKHQPDLVKVIRNSFIVPQYTVDSVKVKKQLIEKMQGYPGIYLANNHFNGCAVSDLVISAHRTALEVSQIQ